MTYGERLIAKLLHELDKTKKYYSYREPTIPSRKSAYRNPDFVIVGAGLGVVVLEVKDWVKIIRGNKEEIEIERADGTRAIEPNPLKIAREYALNLSDQFQKRDELLRKHRGRKVLKFPWMPAVALPNIDRKVIQKLEQSGAFLPGSVFAREQLTEASKLETAIKNLPRPWSLDRPLTPTIRDTIISVITGEVTINDDEGHPIGVPTVQQTVFIREPLKLAPAAKQLTLLPDEFLTNEAKSISESMTVRLVRGVAGSGKSLVLARRAQYLAENYPDLQVLVMAFNVDLVRDLERRIPGAPNLKIINFHKICRQIIGEQWQSPLETEGWLNNQVADLMAEHGFSADFVADEIEWRKELGLYDSAQYRTVERKGRQVRLDQAKREVINTIFDRYIQYQTAHNVLDWSDVAFTALALLENGHPMQHSYDVILIDEAQDFAPSWIKAVKNLLKPGGNLFMCDDPAQSLFRSFSWKAKGVEVAGRTRILRVPFRCTKEITLAAHSLMDNAASTVEEIITPDLTSYELPSGSMPQLISYRDLAQEIRFVEQNALRLRDSGIHANQIAILCHHKNLLKHWAHLRKQGFYVDSFNRMKGLEFRAVLIPHVQTLFHRPDPSRDEAFVSDVRRKVFTAMTRARETLILSYHGQFPAELAALEAHVQHENGAHYGRAR